MNIFENLSTEVIETFGYCESVLLFLLIFPPSSRPECQVDLWFGIMSLKKIWKLRKCSKFTGEHPYKATLLKSHFVMGVLL